MRYGYYPILNKSSEMQLIFDTQQQSCGQKRWSDREWKRWADPFDTQGVDDVIDIQYSTDGDMIDRQRLSNWRRDHPLIPNNAARGAS